MTTKTYEVWLPIYASAKFTCDIEDVENKTYEEIFEEFMWNCKPDSGMLCHSCSDIFEIDTQINKEFIDDVGSEYFRGEFK